MIYIGTSGYSYKDWIGPFYPEGTKDGSMLSYYSSHFNFVEINSTYYHMPRLSLFESLNKKTPEDFQFAVKLFGGFTHERTLGATEAGHFIESIKPILESGKLMCLLAQFPYSFHNKSENTVCLKKIREWFKDININIEFRNQNWINSDTMKLLQNENLGFVCVDEPSIKGLIGNVIASTSDIAYLRMHGRNIQKWYGSEGAERYNYLYSEQELLEWEPRVKELEKRAAKVIVAFNNHPMAKAVANAKTMWNCLQNSC